MKGKDLWADQNWEIREPSPLKKPGANSAKRGKNFERLSLLYSVMGEKKRNELKNQIE